MDASILLDVNTPFDDNKLAMFEKLVATFFTTKNKVEVNFIFKFFLSLNLERNGG
jgi:hypothetical protein